MTDSVKLKAPKDMTSISVGGVEYEVIKGVVTVNEHDVGLLAGMGFSGVEEAATDPALPAGVSSDLAIDGEEADE